MPSKVMNRPRASSLELVFCHRAIVLLERARELVRAVALADEIEELARAGRDRRCSEAAPGMAIGVGGRPSRV
jgi:hypothetical protein